MANRILRYDDSLIPNLLAIGYALGGYAAGLALVTHDSPWLNALGVPLLAHAMVVAAYLLHECAHNSLFARNRHNRWLGEVLMWVTGASYGTYEDIRHKHVRHHTDRADIVAFDFRPRLQRHPRLLRLIRALEWAHIPALDVMMHALVLVLPFALETRRDRRDRVVLVAVVRGAFFAALAAVSLKVLLLYPISYLLMLVVLRFMDVHQHTYEVIETLERRRGDEVKAFDRAFEQRNTYSNLISVRHPWLNLLVLNFPYHNAHHAQPGVPWYRLPRLHRELYGEAAGNVLPFGHLLRAYHRYRVARILNADPTGLDVYGERAREFIGVDGVSFLTAH